MKTQPALNVIYDDWIEYPNSNDLDHAFLSNESSRGITIFYYLSETKPIELDGHSLRDSDWVLFDTKGGVSLWLKASRPLENFEIGRVRMSSSI